MSAAWLPWPVVLPLLAGVLCYLLPAHAARLLAVLAALANVGLAFSIAAQVLAEGVLHHAVGGWQPPLGIVLYADGLSALMLIMTALVMLVISVYALTYFAPNAEPAADGQQVAGHAGQRAFWPLWMLLLAALNALFLARDIFNLYVTLELLGFTAAGLIALSGTPAALAGALRYLLVGLTGSTLYLLGVALMYLGTGVLDLDLLPQVDTSEPTFAVALALMSAGLVIKTALVPFHSWLPAAHASAPAPVSAALSALVVKATFYILLRLWIDTFTPHPAVVYLLAIAGSVAVLYGSVQALRAVRLKVLVAWSTVAQIGYLFMTPLLFTVAGFTGWAAGVYLVVSHAFAKGAMFLAAGTVLHVARSDRIDDLDAITRSVPLSLFAMGVAGLSLMGLPPSGGFTAKWMLLNAAFYGGLWWLAVVVFAGSLLSAAYMFRLTGHALNRAGRRPSDAATAPANLEWMALVLALIALLLGFSATPIIELLQVGAQAEGPALRAIGP